MKLYGAEVVDVNLALGQCGGGKAEAQFVPLQVGGSVDGGRRALQAWLGDTVEYRYRNIETRRIGGIAMESEAVCPVGTTLTLISDKWAVLILRDLLRGRGGSGSGRDPLAG